ncbi:hypothetical protein ACFQ2M_02050 [Kitasatospora saccharophila]|uniref:hypothetical protein n=1 Tax=Kitasatospora saccharophila TaxID=407973 RepID=UPI00362ACE7C
MATAVLRPISCCQRTAPLSGSTPATVPPPVTEVCRASTTVRSSAPKTRRLIAAASCWSAGTASGPCRTRPPPSSRSRFASRPDVPYSTPSCTWTHWTSGREDQAGRPLAPS